MTDSVDGDKGSTGIVAKVTLPDGVVKSLAYPETTSSHFMIVDTLKFASVELTLDEVNIRVEELERSRGIRDGGIEAGIDISPVSGSVGVNFKREPRRIINTMVDLTYRREK